MRRAFAFASVLALALSSSACTFWKEKIPPTWKSATGAETHERLLLDEIKKKNWNVLEQKLAPMFVGVLPSGQKLDRAQVMEHIKTVELTDYSMGDVEVVPAGSDMIVTYRITMNGSIGGKPLPGAPLRVVSVWQDTGNGWILLSRTATPIQGS